MVGSPTTRLTLRRSGNLSMGHQNTRKILKRKKRADTSKGNKTVLGKVATTHTEDGHEQVT